MNVFAVPARRSRARGWWGMALFAATEATLFGTIFGTYVYLRFKAVHWPPDGIASPSITIPLVLTGVLLATSAPMQLASAAARSGRARRAQALLLLALVVQAGYFAMQLQRYADDVQAHPPQLSAYTSITQLMVGADHFHVFVGLLLNLFLLAKLMDGRVTAYRRTGVQAAALYWHVVNALTVVVVLLQLSPSL
ncbi:MAG TPA: cytochrome c oxidase subunit 3 [Gaiellaceae bacterium]|nr:cytochrome c oxidase subunit 3 [Gaiellaceae bacterium]